MLLRIITALGVLVAARELSWSGLFHQDRRLLDFRVFWCGGRVAVEGGNPYAVGRLLVCEHQHATPFMHASPNLVMPFVLPPFDLAPFDLLARLPYDVACVVYAVLCSAAVAGAIVLVARAARVALPVCAAALALALGLPSLWLGQIVPFELVVLAAAAIALNGRRDRLAGALAALALIEPHIGIFVVVALFVLVPGARVTSALGTLALLVLGIAMVGPDVSSAYFTSLSQHAAAEARWYEQYSLTYLVSFAGAPRPVAIALGAASSIALIVAGVVLARMTSAQSPRAALVFIPAACSVLGGTFVHVTQMAVAIPAALLLMYHAASPLARRSAAFAVMLLAVPWPYPITIKQTLAASALVLGILTWYVTRSYWRVAAAVAVCWLAFTPVENHAPGPQTIPILGRAAPSASPSVSWGLALDQMSPHRISYVIDKIPTWLGLLATLAAAGWGGLERLTEFAESRKSSGLSQDSTGRYRPWNRRQDPASS